MMTPSPNKVIGSLLYRTREALNKDDRFKVFLSTQYSLSGNCFIGNNFQLWYYPGTHSEISDILRAQAQMPQVSKYRFPAIFNMQGFARNISGDEVTCLYNLIIVGSVISDWDTAQREYEVFDPLLRPIYNEFMRQVEAYPYFRNDYGIPPHRLVDRFTTGEKEKDELLRRYDDYIDGIELHSLRIEMRTDLCNKDLEIIERENALATPKINY